MVPLPNLLQRFLPLELTIATDWASFISTGKWSIHTARPLAASVPAARDSRDLDVSARWPSPSWQSASLLAYSENPEQTLEEKRSARSLLISDSTNIYTLSLYYYTVICEYTGDLAIASSTHNVFSVVREMGSVRFVHWGTGCWLAGDVFIREHSSESRVSWVRLLHLHHRRQCVAACKFGIASLAIHSGRLVDHHLRGFAHLDPLRPQQSQQTTVAQNTCISLHLHTHPTTTRHARFTAKEWTDRCIGQTHEKTITFHSGWTVLSERGDIRTHTRTNKSLPTHSPLHRITTLMSGTKYQGVLEWWKCSHTQRIDHSICADGLSLYVVHSHTLAESVSDIH